MKNIINALLYIWQLPQNILGLILLLFYKYEDNVVTAKNGNKIYFSKYMTGGISLGKYSIINSYYAGYKSKTKPLLTTKEILKLDVVKHEALGHGTQSRYLGPFYLLVIGLPGIIWAWIYGKIIPYTKNGYYVFYTEKWADKLGGVIRK